MHQWQNCKKHIILWWKKWPRQTLFSTKIFLRVERVFLEVLTPVFPISAKKCEKCEIFSGIFALKFCEFRRFFSRQKPAFLFPAKNLRQPRFTAPRSGMSQKSRRKVAELRRRPFFFFFFFLSGEQRKIGEKMPPSA